MATIIKSTNLDGGKTLYNYVGNSEETKPEGANIGENSTFTELDTGNQFYRRGNTWANMKAPGGGSGGGGSLPANFPEEGIANAGKYVGFDANGDYTAKEGGSGGGQFVVTFSNVDLEERTIGSADKTYAQVLAAVAEGKSVVASLSGTGFLIPVAQAINGVPIRFSNATNTDASILALVTLASDESTSFYIDQLVSRAYLEDDIADVYRDLSPLIVNLTLDLTDPEAPAIVGDATFGQIADAHAAGKNVILKSDDEDGVTSISIVWAVKGEDNGVMKVNLVFFNPEKVEITGALAGDDFRLELT